VSKENSVQVNELEQYRDRDFVRVEYELNMFHRCRLKIKVVN